MDANNQLTDFLWQLGLRSPVFVITFVGLVWSLIHWRKSSGPAMLTMIACALLFLGSLIFPALWVWLTPLMRQEVPPQEMINRTIMMNRLITGLWNLATAISIGALVVAVFAGRSASTAERVRRFDEYEDEPSPRPAGGSEPEGGIRAP